MERSLPMRGRKRPKSPHPAIIPESSRFGLVALAVTLLFLWAALTQQTILRLHHSTHTGLRSGGLRLPTGTLPASNLVTNGGTVPVGMKARARSTYETVSARACAMLVPGWN